MNQFNSGCGSMASDDGLDVRRTTNKKFDDLLQSQMCKLLKMQFPVDAVDSAENKFPIVDRFVNVPAFRTTFLECMKRTNGKEEVQQPSRVLQLSGSQIEALWSPQTLYVSFQNVQSQECPTEVYDPCGSFKERMVSFPPTAGQSMQGMPADSFSDCGNFPCGVSPMSQGYAGFSCLSPGNAGAPGMSPGNAGFPGMSQGVLGMSQGNAGVPGMFQGNAGVPSMSQGNAGVPGMSQGNAGVPSVSQGNAGVPGMFQGNAGIPGMFQGNAGVPSMSQGNAGVPSMSQGNAGVPGISPVNTGVSFMPRACIESPEKCQKETARLVLTDVEKDALWTGPNLTHETDITDSMWGQISRKTEEPQMGGCYR